jgi:hypothetical protein
MKIFALCAMLLFTSFGFAKELTKKEKLADFDQLNLLIESSYAPYFYKQQTQSIQAEALKAKYRSQIEESKSNFEYYQTMIRYVSEFHDGHFGITVPSDYKAELPFATDLVEGKVLIGDINRAKVSEKQFPFAKGDELISMNGVPVQKIIDELSQYLGSGFDLSEKRTAAQVLVVRSARRFVVPTGEVELEIRRGTSDIIEKAKLNWEVSGTPFDEKISTQIQFFNKASSSTNYGMLSIQNHVHSIFGKERAERSYRCSGDTRIAIPKDATIIMKKPFVAYYHPTTKGQVGYLRIPHYHWQSQDGKTNTYLEVFQQYEYAIQVLEKNTVGLIIDQDHNCGGSVDFLHGMLSLFISEPVTPMQFQLLATKKEYFDFKSWIRSMPENTIAQKDFQSVLDLIKSTWEKGEFLTTKTSISGDAVIYPNRIRYTKPIVMLIDELSGSGGDAFPALMGGYKRATLLGTRTSGLGGHVEEVAPLNYSGLNLRMTKSLFYRPDGVAVENNGAVPDVPYVITRDDYVYEYKNYQKFYLKTLLDLIE